MTKVCHLSSVHKWNDTRIFYKECITLAKSGYDVYLVAPNAPTQTIDNVSIRGVEVKKSGRLNRIIFVSWKVLRKGLSTKSKIYHFHDPELIWIGIILRILGKKVIFDVHENVRAQIKDKEWVVFPKFVAFMYSILEWISAKLFHIIIAEDSYETIFKGKTTVTKVLNYPNLEVFKSIRTQPSQENGILYVGLVSKLRGIFEIIDALKRLDDKGVQFHFHCVGPMFENIKTEIEQNKNYQQIKNNITFYGHLPVYEAYKLAEKSKLGVSILHPVPNYLRSYSTKIFEYMALGLPFIVSDFEIYNFVKEKEVGFCVNPLSSEEIAEKMSLVLENKFDIEAMIRREIEISETYSWKNQEINLIELYTKICK